MSVTSPAIDNLVVTSQNSLDRSEIEVVIASGKIPMAWQPIVGMGTRQALGYEALARFSPTKDSEGLSPSAWFSAAKAFGLSEDLEVLAVRSALAELQRIPEKCFVALNVSLGAVVALEHGGYLEGVAAERVVLEFTETSVLDPGYERANETLVRLRARGVRTALDDTGSGLVTVPQLLDVRSDYMKLDVDVTRGVDTDVTKQAIAYAINSLAERTGATTIAEGVETSEEADTLATLGIPAAQGYFFARPSRLDKLREAGWLG